MEASFDEFFGKSLDEFFGKSLDEFFGKSLDESFNESFDESFNESFANPLDAPLGESRGAIPLSFLFAAKLSACR